MRELKLSELKLANEVTFNNTIHVFFPIFNLFSFFCFPPPPAPALTSLPFLGYPCQKHNLTVDTAGAALLDRPGFQPGASPSLDAVLGRTGQVLREAAPRYSQVKDPQ